MLNRKAGNTGRARVASHGVRRVLSAAVLVSLVALSVASLGTAAGAANGPKKGGILKVGGLAQWTSLDPDSTQAGLTAQPYFSAIYDGLLRQSGTKILPDLIKSWSFGSKDLTLTLHVRPGVKFTDGTPFNAAAVKTNLVRDAVPGTCNCSGFLKSIANITVSGADTLVLHFSQKDGSILETLAGSTATYVVSPTQIASSPSSIGTMPIGAGPFMVQSNVPNATLVLVRNSHYWNNPLPYLSGITFTYLANDSAGLSDVESGAIDVEQGNISAPVVGQARQAGSLRVVTMPGSQWYYLWFNTKIAPFNNPLAREAIFYATNEAALAKAVSGGIYIPTQFLDASGMVPYLGTKLKGELTYDPAKAQALVQQLGGLTFSGVTIGTSTLQSQWFSDLNSEWSAVGIHFNASGATTPSAAVGTLISGTFQLFYSPYGSYTSLGEDLEQVIGCGTAFNTVFCDQTFQSLLSQAENAVSPAKQIALYTAAEKQLIVTDTDVVPLWYAPLFRIQQHNVDGIPVNDYVYYDSAYLK